MDSLLQPITDTEEHLFCNAMMKRLDNQRRNEQFCDLILEVGSGDDQASLKAHRIVLCAASPFFFKALNSEMKEKNEGVIRLKGTSKAVMEKVLDYLYTGHVEITKENAYELFEQAEFFLLPGLQALSCKFIVQTLDLSNCIMAYYFSDKYQHQELHDGAVDFIIANFVDVAGTEDFLNLSAEEAERFLYGDDIIVNKEEEVFQVIVNWMENFLQLLRHVRCIYVSRSYAFDVMLQHPLVKASMACTEFILDAMKEVSNGTEECFLSQLPRECLRTHEEAIVICGTYKTLWYLPFEGKLYDLCDMPFNHNSYNYTMSSLHGKLYVVGGSESSQRSNVECYDPYRNLWTCAKAPEVVKHCAGTATLQGFLYAVGGKENDNEPVSTVQKYSLDTNQWQAVSPLGSPKSNVCAVADGSYLYAIGGISATGEYLDIVERYDPGKNSWQKLPSTHAKRASAAGIIFRQKVYVFGGLSKESTAEYPCEMFDPDTNTWSVMANVVAPKNFASAVSFLKEMYVVGTFQNEEQNFMSLRAYDIDKNFWDCCAYFKIQEGEAYHISSLRVSKKFLTKWNQVTRSKDR